MDRVALDIQRALYTAGEPTRFRILELLATRPHTVGEVADALGALQPQTTKHLQALEAARIIRVHRLGRRRVARLDRETLAHLATYFHGLAAPDPDDSVLDDYQDAIAREMARPSGQNAGPVLHFERVLPASAEDVWRAWTDPQQAAAWWAPRHFRVTAFELEPSAGAPIRIILREGDGAEYASRGQVVDARPGRLVFTLAPVDSAGEPLFHALHTLTITGTDPATVTLLIEVSDVRTDAASAIAGLEPGWRQLLDALDTYVRHPDSSPE
ncbi:SRPBCC domain-containing protein [Raineyella sp. LH-20]|uniref:SRPBCC domain-containing protein n=1 Tax=Raineyella sp. LH-20 TaxID=3081204 RepID=UPI002954E306|nr:SRPBCC domain-containing protein [Raineyella sp. LH-20]WOP18465.1 SRPBCC domain-containing protein [Raineyella sp. LH-20]